MVNQTEKAQAFKALHDNNKTFVIPNPWDAGSARLLEGLGFKALANYAIASTITAANQISESGSFDWVGNTTPGGVVKKLFA